MEKSEISEIQQAANASIKTETGTSSENENQDERLVSAIRKMFEELEPSVSNKRRIYKVPYQLRTLNPEAYTPHVISIGPYHHNNKNCRTMEKHKVRYFKSFMKRQVDTKGLEMENLVRTIREMENEVDKKMENLVSTIREIENEVDKKMENLVSTIREMENEIRSCYVETVQLKSDDFVKMIMLDASFILELFLRNKEDGFRDDDDRIAVEKWLLEVAFHELLLLENQLPFFVIEKLYHLALPSKSNSIPLIQLTFEFFEELNIHKSPYEEIKHFTDLLRFFQLPPTNKLPQRVEQAIFPKYSVTKLLEAGVTFKKAQSKCEPDEVALSIRDEKPLNKRLLDEVASSVWEEDPSRRILDFKNGVLEIPHLVFDDYTEAFVRNIMALEQCDPKRETYVTDFYLILDNLINTEEDVELLINNDILVNNLGDNNAVKSMINSLNKGIFYNGLNSEFHQLSEALNKHYERNFNKWMAMLEQQYFSNPWRSAATVAAIILLVLTLIQTVFSILQVVL